MNFTPPTSPATTDPTHTWPVSPMSKKTRRRGQVRERERERAKLNHQAFTPTSIDISGLNELVVVVVPCLTWYAASPSQSHNILSMTVNN